MAVISVEIDNDIAEKIKPFEVLKYNDLENMYEKKWATVVDFGKGVPVSEVLSFLKKS